MVGNVIILLGLQVVQIHTTYSLGHLGQLSTFTTVCMMFRSLGRLFTTLSNTADIHLMLEFGIHCMLNAALIGQRIYYGGIWGKGESKRSHQDWSRGSLGLTQTASSRWHEILVIWLHTNHGSSLMNCCLCMSYAWLTHWGRDKMDSISQTTFSNVFSSMKMYGFRLTFHWNLFLGVQLTIFQHWFR